MNTSQRDQQLEFKPVRCHKCDGVLFEITPTQGTFSIRVKCRRCTRRRRVHMKRRRVNVYVVVQISLESAERPGIDSNPENSARPD
jgi:phage FluMu protein Com